MIFSLIEYYLIFCAVLALFELIFEFSLFAILIAGLTFILAFIQYLITQTKVIYLLFKKQDVVSFKFFSQQSFLSKAFQFSLSASLPGHGFGVYERFILQIGFGVVLCIFCFIYTPGVMVYYPSTVQDLKFLDYAFFRTDFIYLLKGLLLFLNLLFFWGDSSRPLLFVDEVYKTRLFIFYVFIYLFLVSLLCSINNFVLFFLCVELCNYVTYLLASERFFHQNVIKNFFMFFTINGLLSLIFAIAVCSLLLLVHNLTFADLTFVNFTCYEFGVTSSNKGLISRIYGLICYILVFKLASGPFFFWVKTVYQTMPFYLLGFLSQNAKFLYIVLLLRLVTLMTVTPFEFELWFLSASTWTLFAGTFSTLYQVSLKTLAILSALFHLGLIFMCMSGITMMNDSSLIYTLMLYLCFYLLSMFFIWRVGMLLTEATRREDVGFNELGIFFRYVPLLGAWFCFIWVSLAGMPPMIGFFMKFALFVEAFILLHPAYVLAMLILSVIGSYYYLSTIKIIFFDLVSRFQANATRSTGIMTDFEMTLMLITEMFYLFAPFYLGDIFFIMDYFTHSK